MLTVEEIELLKMITISVNGQIVDIEIINNNELIINGQHKSISYGNNISEVV